MLETILYRLQFNCVDDIIRQWVSYNSTWEFRYNKQNIIIPVGICPEAGD